MRLRKLIDYHIHTELCRHGKGSLENYVKSAIKKGFVEIGFSEHFPEEFVIEDLPKKYRKLIPIEDYSMTFDEFPGYVQEVLSLQEKYQDEISIKLGTEFDFPPNKKKFIQQQIKKYDFDYVLGSVHHIYIDGKPFAFDDNRYLEFYDEYDIVQCWETYYAAVAELIHSDLFDIISHLDLMKKYGFKLRDGSEFREEKFNSLVDAIVELLENHNSVIELNTGGARKKVAEFYPEDDILLKTKNLGIVLGSDSHHPDEVGYQFDIAIKKLKQMGYTHLIRFTKRKREKYPI